MAKITTVEEKEEKEEKEKPMQAKLVGTILSYLLIAYRNKKRGSVKQKQDYVLTLFLQCRATTTAI
jgi:hypothetical protein